MINLFCGNCSGIPDAQLQLRVEGRTIVIECLNCGDMKRLKNDGRK